MLVGDSFAPVLSRDLIGNVTLRSADSLSMRQHNHKSANSLCVELSVLGSYEVVIREVKAKRQRSP
jgi:hypothetical protein